jgi:23S rRNA (pseudouridine1915-N3)-methyltransferase
LKEITIVSVIKRPPGWVDSAVDEYQKRLSGDTTLAIVDVPPANRTKNSVTEKILKQEADAIYKAMPQNSFSIALDEKGARVTTRNFADKLDQLTELRQPLCFIIGGPDGLAASVKSSANTTWSLSDLTLPHAMVRVILIEQLYRAFCILKGHPYHRD